MYKPLTTGSGYTVCVYQRKELDILWVCSSEEGIDILCVCKSEEGGEQTEKFSSKVQVILIHTWQFMGMPVSVSLFQRSNGGHANSVEYRSQKFSYIYVNLTGHTQDLCAEHDKTLVKETK